MSLHVYQWYDFIQWNQWIQRQGPVFILADKRQGPSFIKPVSTKNLPSTEKYCLTQTSYSLSLHVVNGAPLNFYFKIYLSSSIFCLPNSFMKLGFIRFYHFLGALFVVVFHYVCRPLVSKIFHGGKVFYEHMSYHLLGVKSSAASVAILCPNTSMGKVFSGHQAHVLSSSARSYVWLCLSPSCVQTLN